MEDLEKVKQHARDLRREEPRSPYDELGGEPYAARCVDKCRAALLGWNGEFQFGCAMDEHFFADTGLDRRAFRDLVAAGASDGEVDAWIRAQRRPKTT